MEHLLTIVQKLGIFIVLAQTILHFRANDSYEKYIRILTNIMILSLIIVPVLAIFRKDIPREMRMRIHKYQQRILESESMMTEDMETKDTEQLMEKQVIQQLQEEIKNKLNNSKTSGIQKVYDVENVKIIGLDEAESLVDKQLKIVITVTKNRITDNTKSYVDGKAEREQEVENREIEQVKIENIVIGDEKDTVTETDNFERLRVAYAKQLEIDETCVEVR